MKKTNFFYFLYVILITIIIIFISDYNFLKVLIGKQVKFLLELFGISVKLLINNGEVFLHDVEINKLCTGIYVMSLFIGLILPLSYKWLKKIIWSVIFSLIIYVLNVFRIFIVMVLYENNISWFISHDLVGKGSSFIVLFLLFVWLFKLFPEIVEKFELLIKVCKKSMRL